MTPLDFTRSVRNLNRLRRVAAVLTQHGFGHVVTQMNLARFVPVWMLRRRGAAGASGDAAPTLGRRLAQVCTDLGPTFVKLGQMLTTRPDLVPADIRRDLCRLQDDVPPFDTPTAMAIVAESLGRPVSACYASLDGTPIACGSIGQVYRARSHGGRALVVKVRRPGVERIVERDMALLRWLAVSLESVLPELRMYHPTMLVDEFEQVLTREMDFIHEASVTARLGDALRAVPGVRAPHVFWDLCTDRVLTMGAVSGTSLETVVSRGDASVDGPLVARRLADAYMHQVFNVGLFHADPHPGNILIDPPGEVCLIDFGQAGRISSDTMTQLVVLTYAAASRELEVVIDVLGDLGALGPDANRRDLHGALAPLMEKYHGLPMKRLDLGTLVAEFSDVVRRHDVVLPREIVVLLKALGMVGGVVTRLDPELDMLALLRPRLKETMLARVSPGHLARAATLTGWNLVGILRHAPGQVREALRRLSAGAWQLNVRHENIDRLIRELDRSSNRMAFAIVIAAIIVGSSVVVSAGSDAEIFDIKVQYVGVVGYVVAGVLGLGLSWAIFRSGRLH